MGEVVGIGDFITNSRVIVDVLSFIPPKYYEGLEVSDTYFAGTKVRLYNPENRRTDGAIVFIHGGGWIICSVETHDQITSELARRLGTLVVSVDYRLSPETPYPGALNDVMAAVLHLMENAQEFGVDPHRVALVGDSAGGNLAAATVLKLRELRGRGIPQPKLQALIYPALQAVDLNLPSYVQNNGVALGTAEDTALVFLAYMGLDLKHAKQMAQNNHTTQETRLYFSQLIRPYLPDYDSLVPHVPNQDRLVPVSVGDSLVPPPAKDRLVPVPNQDRLVPVPDKDRLVPVSDGDSLVPVPNSDRLVPQVAVEDRLVPVSSEEELISVPNEHRRDPSSPGVHTGSSDLVESLKHYLTDPYCFPLTAADVTGLPPTYIATAEYDILRDDGVLYAKRLQHAGNDVTYVNYPDGFHGILAFFMYPVKLDVGARMMEDLIMYLGQHL